MTEFKIGDRVKVIDYQYDNVRGKFVGKTGTVRKIVDGLLGVDSDDGEFEDWGFFPTELKLIQDPRDAALDAIKTLTEAWETNGEVPTYLIRMILSTVNR